MNKRHQWKPIPIEDPREHFDLWQRWYMDNTMHTSIPYAYFCTHCGCILSNDKAAPTYCRGTIKVLAPTPWEYD